MICQLAISEINFLWWQWGFALHASSHRNVAVHFCEDDIRYCDNILSTAEPLCAIIASLSSQWIIPSFKDLFSSDLGPLLQFFQQLSAVRQPPGLLALASSVPTPEARAATCQQLRDLSISLAQLLLKNHSLVPVCPQYSLCILRIKVQG